MHRLDPIPMRPAMVHVLEGLEEHLATAQHRFQVAKQRCDAYVIQCAEQLGVNDSRFTFDPGTRTYCLNTVPDSASTESGADAGPR